MAGARSTATTYGPWLWGPTIDLTVFGGSAVLALALVAAGHLTGWSQAAEAPVWVWLALVLVVDVAHVYATVFRTYLDGVELRQRPWLYFGTPAACYLAGVALHLWGPGPFWTVVAYVAVFHFVRQQIGWVAVYRARAGQRQRLDRWLDDAAIYVATGYPLIAWHAHLDQTRFVWMRDGDFLNLAPLAARLEPIAHGAWWLLLGVFLVRQVVLAARGTVHLGKTTVVVTTAAIWYVGIVVTNSDFDFTVTNVIVHGVPYFALLFAYARAHRRERPTALGSRIVMGGVGAFLAVLVGFAFLEETAWDLLVWHERPWLFGDGFVNLNALALSLVVPLLAVPQLTHYVLDGFLWRRGESRRLPAQRVAIGFPALATSSVRRAAPSP